MRMAWAYGASFDKAVTRHISEAGLFLVEDRYVVDGLIQYVTLRPDAPGRPT